MDALKSDLLFYFSFIAEFFSYLGLKATCKLRIRLKAKRTTVHETESSKRFFLTE